MPDVGAKREQREARRTDLSRALIRLRRERGLSQARLAQLATEASPEGRKVSDGFIGRIEVGERGASIETLDAIAIALGLTDLELMKLYEAAGIDFDDDSAQRVFADPSREITPDLAGFPSTIEARMAALEVKLANQERKLDEILDLLRATGAPR